MTFSEINNVAVICTKDRQIELFKILQNLETQVEKFFKIIVIDSSKISFFSSSDIRFSGIDFYQTSPGLTHQRNFGLTKIPGNSNFCHFFDDDVVLDDAYLLNFNKYIEENSDIRIATGRQKIKAPSNFFRLFTRITNLSGKLLSNGINISPNYFNLTDCTELEWMPGCNMIIAYGLIANGNVYFDELNRTGYSMGEDVDISVKLRSYGKILYLPNCVYTHNLSINNRMDEIQKYLEFLKHRYLLTRDYPEKFNTNIFFLSIRVELILFTFLYFFTKKRHFKSWGEAIRIFRNKTI